MNALKDTQLCVYPLFIYVLGKYKLNQLTKNTEKQMGNLHHLLQFNE